MKRLVLLALGASLAWSVPAHSALMLTNPGFETGALSPWFQDQDFSSGTNWFVTNVNPHSGTFAAQDVGNKSIRQNFAPVATNQITTASVWLRHPNGAGLPAAIDLFYTDGTHTENLVTTQTTNWEQFNLLPFLTLGKGLNGISVFGNSTPDAITMLDDALISTDPVVGVPEPAAWAMLLSGFGLIGLFARRRRRAAVRFG